MCLDRNNAGELRDTVNFLDALGVSSILVSATYEQGLWQELEKNCSFVKNRYAQRILEVACAARSASGN